MTSLDSADNDSIPTDSPLQVSFGGRLFFDYLPDEPARPFIEVLNTVDGRRVTRDYETAPEDSKDHVHHRGVWWGHGEVNDVDLWSEYKSYGRIVSSSAPVVTTSGEITEIRHDSTWQDPSGRVLLEDEHLIRAHPATTDGTQALDIDVTLTATDAPIALGDTKEAGIVAIRVAPSMEGRHGGRIELSTGAVGEDASWGRAAEWCDYSGEVDGSVVGVAILDHPSNPLRAHWHVRDYGLMTANPFGLHDFFEGSGQDGSLRIEPGTPVRFRYRVLVHLGDATAGNVPVHFAAYLAEE